MRSSCGSRRYAVFKTRRFCPFFAPWRAVSLGRVFETKRTYEINHLGETLPNISWGVDKPVITPKRGISLQRITLASAGAIGAVAGQALDLKVLLHSTRFRATVTPVKQLHE